MSYDNFNVRSTGNWPMGLGASEPTFPFPPSKLGTAHNHWAVQAAYPGAGPDQPDGLAHTQRSSLVRPRIDRVWTAQ
jgi:hypothetical protein